MRKKILLSIIINFIFILCPVLPKSSLAQSEAITSGVPQSAFYIGLGGSYNSIDFGDQDVFAVGTASVFQNGQLTSTGSAAGPAEIHIGSESTFSPSVQLGYFQKFSNSDWLWGVNFTYNYLNTTANVQNALLPQAGSFTLTAINTTVPFIGAAVVRSYRTSIKHQMSLTPFIGRSFERNFVYLGAGPTLSRVQTNLNGLVGFADINGQIADISGPPVSFSRSDLVFGGAAVVGATYFFNEAWFLDVKYTYSVTKNSTSNYSSSFVNQNGIGDSVISGTLVGDSSGKVITQGITATINMVF